MNRVFAAIGLAILVSCAGCATTETAVKNAAEACKGTAWDDVKVALPLVMQLTICEIEKSDCSAVTSALEQLGLSDLPGVKACALSKTHDASVALVSATPK